MLEELQCLLMRKLIPGRQLCFCALIDMFNRYVLKTPEKPEY